AQRLQRAGKHQSDSGILALQRHETSLSGDCLLLSKTLTRARARSSLRWRAAWFWLSQNEGRPSAASVVRLPPKGSRWGLFRAGAHGETGPRQACVHNSGRDALAGAGAESGALVQDISASLAAPRRGVREPQLLDQSFGMPVQGGDQPDCARRDAEHEEP